MSHYLRRFGSVLLWLLIPGLILSGCNKNASSSQPGKTDKQGSPVHILHEVRSETFYDENGKTPLLKARITVPKIANSTNSQAINAINQYYQDQIDSFMEDIRDEDLEIAQADLEFAQNNGYEFRAHCIETNFEIAYNAHNLLSILNTRYVNMGGAHPSYTRTAQTFDLNTGKQLALTGVLGLDQQEFLENFYSIATKQIKASEEKAEFIYYEDYPDGLRQYYSADDFILRENGLVFYYQLYAIAPFAFGFPEFELPYKELGDTAMKIEPLPANLLEKDVYAAVDQLLSRNQEAFIDIFGMGYYVNWNDYRYELTDIKTDSAILKIYSTTQEPPAGAKEEITLTGKLFKESDNWLLEKMIQ